MFKFAKHKSVLQKDGVMFLWVLKFSKKKKKRYYNAEMGEGTPKDAWWPFNVIMPKDVEYVM